MQIRYSVRSHKGLVRENNQDNVYADGLRMARELCNRPFSLDGVANSPLILAVCDGMGGESFGEEASALAVDLLAEKESAIKAAQLSLQKKAVQDYADSVNKTLNDKYDRAGTTLALTIITAQGVCCYNIGDTRVYYIKNSVMKQASVDHTYAAKFGSSSDVQHRCEIKNGNKLTRCIGIGNHCVVESGGIVRGKTRLLICSDGLTDMVAEQEIESLLVGADSVSAAADGLVEAALANGGCDNVSVIVADIPMMSVAERIKNMFVKGSTL